LGYPLYADFLHWLGSQARVISFDRRGAGASSTPSGESLPSWEAWADDARAVLDSAGSEGATLLGQADSGPAAILFAASHPERTRGLILINSVARWSSAPGYPAGHPKEVMVQLSQFVQDAWGTDALAEMSAPDLARRDPEYRRWFNRGARMYMSPKEASRLFTYQLSLDVRDALPLVQVPTLVLAVEGYEAIPADHGHYLAEHIAGAQFALLPGSDAFYVELVSLRDHVAEFLGGLTPSVEPDRALAAILFTDIVDSTARASALGIASGATSWKLMTRWPARSWNSTAAESLR